MSFTTLPGSGTTLTAATLSALVTELRPLVAYKTADETVTSSITLQNDDQMTITLAASTNYEIETVVWAAGDDLGDLRMNYSAPSSVVGWAGQVALLNPSGASTASDANMVAYAFSSGVLTSDLAIGIADTNLVVAVIKGFLEVSTGGTFTARWGQVTSSGTGTTIKRGSWLKAKKA